MMHIATLLDWLIVTYALSITAGSRCTLSLPHERAARLELLERSVRWQLNGPDFVGRTYNPLRPFALLLSIHPSVTFTPAAATGRRLCMGHWRFARLRSAPVVLRSASILNYDHAKGTITLMVPEDVDISPLPRDVFIPDDMLTGGLPPLPTGAQFIIDETNAGIAFGAMVWRAAGTLARWMKHEPETVLNARVLELGSGTGASGMFAAALGAELVVLTDGEEKIMPILEANVQRNRALFPNNVITSKFLFGDPLPASIGNMVFDLVIGSDIVYAVHDDPKTLCQTLQELLRSGVAKRVIFSHEHRRTDMFDVDVIVRNQPAEDWTENDQSMRIFLESAAEHELHVRQLAMEKGFRKQVPPCFVDFQADISIFEVYLQPPAWAAPLKMLSNLRTAKVGSTREP